ncbi:MAG: chemotaxis protein CheW [Bacillota bacterium]
MADEARGQSGEIQLVTFKLGAGEYGIDIMQVQEIIRLPEIVHVPKAPEFVEGVINLREQILPVIDLAKRFGAAEAPQTAQASGASGPSSASGTPVASGAGRRTDSSRIVVANIKGSPAVGLIVDAVCEVIRLPMDAIEPLPDIVADVDSRFLRGIGRLNDRLIILVDLGKVLSADETAQLQGDFTAALESPS